MASTLSNVATHFNQNNLFTQLVPQNEQVPFEQLFVLLGQDHKKRDLRLEMLVLPNMEELDMLQFFVHLPFSPNPTTLPNAAQFIQFLNEQLPVGHFCINEANGWIYFRYVMAQPAGNVNPETAYQVFWMVDYVVKNFVQVLEDVIEGDKDAKSAKNALRAIISQ